MVREDEHPQLHSLARPWGSGQAFPSPNLYSWIRERERRLHWWWVCFLPSILHYHRSEALRVLQPRPLLLLHLRQVLAQVQGQSGPRYSWKEPVLYIRGIEERASMSKCKYALKYINHQMCILLTVVVVVVVIIPPSSSGPVVAGTYLLYQDGWGVRRAARESGEFVDMKKSFSENDTSNFITYSPCWRIGCRICRICRICFFNGQFFRSTCCGRCCRCSLQEQKTCED